MCVLDAQQIIMVGEQLAHQPSSSEQHHVTPPTVITVAFSLGLGLALYTRSRRAPRAHGSTPPRRRQVTHEGELWQRPQLERGAPPCAAVHPRAARPSSASASPSPPPFAHGRAPPRRRRATRRRSSGDARRSNAPRRRAPPSPTDRPRPRTRSHSSASTLGDAKEKLGRRLTLECAAPLCAARADRPTRRSSPGDARRSNAPRRHASSAPTARLCPRARTRSNSFASTPSRRLLRVDARRREGEARATPDARTRRATVRRPRRPPPDAKEKQHPTLVRRAVRSEAEL